MQPEVKERLEDIIATDDMVRFTNFLNEGAQFYVGITPFDLLKHIIASQAINIFVGSLQPNSNIWLHMVVQELFNEEGWEKFNELIECMEEAEPGNEVFGEFVTNLSEYVSEYRLIYSNKMKECEEKIRDYQNNRNNTEYQSNLAYLNAWSAFHTNTALKSSYFDETFEDYLGPVGDLQEPNFVSLDDLLQREPLR